MLGKILLVICALSGGYAWTQIGNGSLPSDVLPGSSVAFAGTGALLAATGYPGVISLYTNEGAGWMLQQEINASIAFNTVSISYDGNTLVGAGRSAVVIFKRDPQVNSWKQSAQMAFSGVGDVALSAEANLIAVGAWIDVGQVLTFVPVGGSSPLWNLDATLVGSNAIGNSGQGASVALSAGGDILAECGIGDNNGVGAVWIFTRDSISSIWTEQGKLIGSGSGDFRYIISVTLSANGNVLAFGGSGTQAYLGAVWVFERQVNTSQWVEQARLQSAYEVVNMQQGYAVALSADGGLLASTVMRATSAGTPETWIFQRNSSSDSDNTTALPWSTPPVRIPALGYSYNQGYSVALSTTGELLASGAYVGGYWGGVLLFQNGANAAIPAILAPTTSPTTSPTTPPPSPTPTTTPTTSPKVQHWSQIGSSQLVADGFPGASVAFSGAGDLLAAAGSPGGVWVFAPSDRSGEKWIEQSKLVDPILGTDAFLASVALSGDGKLLVSGGPQYVVTWKRGVKLSEWDYQSRLNVVNVSGGGAGIRGFLSVALNSAGDILAVGAGAGVGYVAIFTFDSSSASSYSWKQEAVMVGSKSDPLSVSNQGDGVALNAAGDTLAFSGSGDNNQTGAVWVFTRDSKSGVWSEEAKLRGSTAGGYRLLLNVQLSALGDVLAFSGFASDNWLGAVWVFERQSNTTNTTQWTELAKLQLPKECTNMQQGFSISLSGDGQLLASTVTFTNTSGSCGNGWETPETWIFQRNPGASSESDKLWSSAPIRIGSKGDTTNQGYSVALSTSGDLLASGAWHAPYSGGVLMFRNAAVFQDTTSANPKMPPNVFYPLVIILPILLVLGLGVLAYLRLKRKPVSANGQWLLADVVCSCRACVSDGDLNDKANLGDPSASDQVLDQQTTHRSSEGNYSPPNESNHGEGEGEGEGERPEGELEGELEGERLEGETADVLSTEEPTV